MPKPGRNAAGDVVVTADGRLAGCRGRVLAVLLLVVILLAALFVMMVWAMDEESPPITAPARTAPTPPGS